MKTISMPFGRSIHHKPAHPERTARSTGLAWDALTTFKTWPTREAMARVIRKEQARAPSNADWKPCVPLKDGEGY